MATIIKKQKGGKRNGLGDPNEYLKEPSNTLEQPTVAPIDENRKKTVTYSLKEKTITLIRKRAFDENITKSELVEMAIQKYCK